MRGTLTFVPVARPMDILQLAYVPPREWFEAMLGGQTIDVVNYYDHHCTADGVFVPAIMLVNAAAAYEPEPNVNFWATAAWHMVANAKGHIIHQHLHGNVIIITGDGDYLANVLV